eukprot:scaffold41220_cov71-Phaeocystis_antarctica.AAC.3
MLRELQRPAECLVPSQTITARACPAWRNLGLRTRRRFPSDALGRNGGESARQPPCHCLEDVSLVHVPACEPIGEGSRQASQSAPAQRTRPRRADPMATRSAGRLD